ncbi:DUF4321 domain-containing protein [Candidatus Calescamantes bacterium]|nr:DUF4321 domain-containing protein [Candidatus Calescamantes bacterium]
MKENKNLKETAKKKVSFFIAIVILFGIGGGVISEILEMVMGEGKFRDILTHSLELYMKPVEINLAVINLTFGLGIKFTIISLFFMFLGGWLYFKAK